MMNKLRARTEHIFPEMAIVWGTNAPVNGVVDCHVRCDIGKKLLMLYIIQKLREAILNKEFSNCNIDAGKGIRIEYEKNAVNLSIVSG